MGTVGYLANFQSRLCKVSEPLGQLTQKNIGFVWDEIHGRAFSRIKEMVTAPPLLKYYEREKDLLIQCDASEGDLGATSGNASKFRNQVTPIPINQVPIFSDRLNVGTDFIGAE